MNIEMFLVTFKRDFRYLTWWLKGFEKYVRGINRCSILVPSEDIEELKRLVGASSGESGIPIRCLEGNEWPGKGFLWHMAQIMRAEEWCPEADVIVHTDPDRVFAFPYDRDHIVRDGKPIIVYGSYKWLREEVQANLDMWRQGVHNAIGWEPPQEVMRRMPIPHIKEVYPLTRTIVERHVRVPFDDYVKKQRNEFPQSLCEFNTLGAIAWSHLNEKYHWLNQQKGEYPPDVVINCWSHREPQPGDIEEFRKVGLE